MPLTHHDTGGYAYDPGLRFASNGVVSLPGTVIDHAILQTPLGFDEGCEAIRQHLHEMEVDLDGLCGIEVRLPATLTLDEFVAFNNRYLEKLDGWGLLRSGGSPLARTNVSPTSNPPSQPSVIAASYATTRSAPQTTYVISGVADLPAGGQYPEDVLRRGDQTVGALGEKAELIVRILEEYIAALGVQWLSGDIVNLYSHHDLAKIITADVLPAAGHVPDYGVVLHDAAPPVVDLELEIDVRRYGRVLRIET